MGVRDRGHLLCVRDRGPQQSVRHLQQLPRADGLLAHDLRVHRAGRTFDLPARHRLRLDGVGGPEAVAGGRSGADCVFDRVGGRHHGHESEVVCGADCAHGGG